MFLWFCYGIFNANGGVIMLINFSVGNFLSFKEKQTLFLTAVKTCKHRLEENTFGADKENFLRTVAIYGANASGKTKLFEAVLFFQSFIQRSAIIPVGENRIPRVAFLLDAESKKKPSLLEMEFVAEGIRYRYGFEVSDTEVVREWLFLREMKPRAREKPVFLRETKNGAVSVEIRQLEGAKGLQERTRANVLFLSVCSQFAVKETTKITDWVTGRLNIVAGATAGVVAGGNFGAVADPLFLFSINVLQQGDLKRDMVGFLSNADTAIQSVDVESGQGEPLVINTKHNTYDADGVVTGVEALPLNRESEGTKKLFALSAPIIDTLRHGKVLFVDELDARLHPNLTARIIELFNSARTNPKNAQLVFNTHDANLLKQTVYSPDTKKEERLLRRDQVYFVEKDNCEASKLYSFSDFRQERKPSVRNDASLEKEYLAGEYGAVPVIRELTGEYHAAD